MNVTETFYQNLLFQKYYNFWKVIKSFTEKNNKISATFDFLKLIEKSPESWKFNENDELS